MNKHSYLNNILLLNYSKTIYSSLSLSLSLLIVFCAITISFFIVIAPQLGVIAAGILFLFISIFILYKKLVPGAPLWAKFIFIVVLGDFILNYGFTNFSVGVGATKVTVAELVLLVTLIYLLFKAWPAFWVSKLAALCLIAYFIVPTVVHLPSNLMGLGAVAARDYLPLVDSLFFFTGMAVVYIAGNKETWLLWRNNFIRILLVLSAFYLSLYAVQDWMLQYSPKVTGYQQAVPLIGYYATGNVLALMGLLALILIPNMFSPNQLVRPFSLILLLFVFGVAFVLLQSRTTYLVFIFFLLILALFGYGSAVVKVFWLGVFVVFCLLMVDLSGIELQGRVGNIGLEMVFSQLGSVTGQGGFEAGSDGVNKRLDWWASAINRWLYDIKSITVGIGFGEPLTTFSVMGSGGEAVVVREPHNSYISVLTRTGLFGFIPWLAFHVILLVTVFREVLIRKSRGDVESAGYFIWILFLFLAILFSAFVQPAFESPQFAVPYFFIAGMVLGQIALEKKGWKS